MRLPRYRTAFALLMCATLTLSACSGGLTSSGITISEAKDSAAAPPSSADTQPQKTTEPKKTTKSKKKPDSEVAQPTTTAKAAPEGWTMVTATIAPISFAIPEDWVPVGSNVSEEQARHNALRASLDVPEAADHLMGLRPEADLIYASTDINNIGDSLYILNTLLPSGIMKSEALLKEKIEETGITVSSVRREQSPLGEVVLMDTESKGVSMTVFLVPVKESQAMAFYALGLDQTRTQDTVRTVVSTLSK